MMRARVAAFATPVLWSTLSWRAALSTRTLCARSGAGGTRTARMLARQQMDSQGREYIRLVGCWKRRMACTLTNARAAQDGFLKLNAMVETGGEAKQRIQQGDVSVNGAVEMRRGRKLRQGDVVQLEEVAYEVEFIADGAEVAGGNWV